MLATNSDLFLVLLVLKLTRLESRLACLRSWLKGEIKTLCFQFQVTPVVPLSSDSWSMSFAKYLELRFYGHQYTRRANAEPCGHSIHHDYHQYFSYNQMVASFR